MTDVTTTYTLPLDTWVQVSVQYLPGETNPNRVVVDDAILWQSSTSAPLGTSGGQLI